MKRTQDRGENGTAERADTKGRILDAALVLFNESGTATVTTNHIAEAAGLSVGNLYYHYKNREEIIRALYERLAGTFDVIFTVPEDRAPGVADLERMLRENYEVLWDYRFFYRELLALTRRDPLLAARYAEVRRRGFDGFRDLLAVFAQSGVLRPVTDPDEVEELARLCWMVSDFYLPFIESGGVPPVPRHLREGVALMRRVLAPYLLTPAVETYPLASTHLKAKK